MKSKQLFYRCFLLFITSLLITMQSFGQSGLIGLWHLDGNTTDASGNGHNGTIEGTVMETAGRCNNAYHFDGNSAIDCGNVDLNSTGEFSVSAWVKSTDPYVFEVWRMVVSKLDASDGGPLELFLGDGRTTNDLPGTSANYLAWDGGIGLYYAFSPYDLSRNAKDGNWHHLAVTFKPGLQIVYFDGAQVGSSTATDPLPNTSSNFRIGGIDFGPYHHPWIGEIDEVAAYNRALSSSEIQTLAEGCGIPKPLVSGFTLVDADADKNIQPLLDGDVLDLSALPPNLNIRVNTVPTKVGSVVLMLDGNKPRTENAPPYAAGGDLPVGDYHALALSLGDHTLTATPYSGKNGTGIHGSPVTIHFTIAGHKVASFTLVNADNDKDIQAISDGSTIDINTLPIHLNIRANTNPAKVGSVIFILDGKKVRTENGFPYALGGDLPSGDYHPFTFSLGEHTLTATPYSKTNGGGLKGKSLTVHFTVESGKQNKTSIPVAMESVQPVTISGDLNSKVKVYPNPFQSGLNIAFNGMGSSQKIITLTDIDGRIISTQKASQSLTQVNVARLIKGSYIIKIQDSDGKLLYSGTVIKK